MPVVDPAVIVPAGVCRCAGLRETFGRGAPPRCGVCVLAERYRQLQAAGFVQCSREHILRYQDCGVPVATTSDGYGWVPSWARRIVDALLGTYTLPPVLTRAAEDPIFCDAVCTIIASSTTDECDRKVTAFARVQGVTINGSAPVETL